MQLQASALYRHTPSGRIAARNEPGAPPAPRLFVGLTREGILWRLRDDLPDDVVRELARLAGAERPPVRPRADPERLPALLACLAADAPVGAIWRGPALRFPERLPEAGGDVRLLGSEVGGDVRLLGPGDGELVAEFEGVASGLAARLPAAAVLEGGRVVALCYAATLPGPAREAGVETLPGFRGRGLGSRAVAAWARAVRAGGTIPLYSTSWSNRSSRALARRLGLLAYGSDLHVG